MNGGYVTELRDLEYFTVVAEQGHLGRAAEMLGLSQPALSKSIARLEDAMEVKLFRGTGKGMELTAEGSLLLSRARELRSEDAGAAAAVSVLCRSSAGGRQADGSRSDVVMSGVWIADERSDRQYRRE